MNLINLMTMIRSILKNRIVIVASCYLVYASLFSYDGRRLLSSDKSGRPLEFVHITHTGGKTIEKAGGTASINWGACHFLPIGPYCTEPDRSYENVIDTNFIRHNIWHTPPKYISAEDEATNFYRGKDLFTVVRNPYTRLVSEYYCPFRGHKGDKRDEAWMMNEWIQTQIKGIHEMKENMDRMIAEGQLIEEIQSPRDLTEKHMIPQTDYVFDDEGKRLVENVIHFESFEQDFSTLMDEYGIDILFPHDMEESGGVLTYRDLSPETIELINQLYASDFAALGYETTDAFNMDNPYTLSATKTTCVSYNEASDECEREVIEKPNKSLKKLDRIEVPIGATHSTTFLLGIFTNMEDEQRSNRERIRNTYLNVDDPRVCSLGEYINQKKELMIAPCRIPYVFVVGGAPDRPAAHLDDEPLEVDSETVAGASEEETDIVYLNISENGTHGKAAAYLKWAASIGSTLQIDFVAKAAPSTLLDMALLMDFIDLDLPPAPYNRRSYGGSPWGYFWEGGYYATSPFYFMSIDITTFVGKTKKIDWEEQEAHDIGRLIFKHPKPIKFINLNPRLFWFEDVTGHEMWYEYWNNRMAELPRRKVNMENEKICQSFKDQGLLETKQ